MMFEVAVSRGEGEMSLRRWLTASFWLVDASKETMLRRDGKLTRETRRRILGLAELLLSMFQNRGG